MVKKWWDQIGKTELLWIPFVCCALALLWYLVSAGGMDNDGYWILATGRELAEGIPKENPFTFVEGLDIVIQQWAWCLLCYRIYEVFGSAGILVMCAGCPWRSWPCSRPSGRCGALADGEASCGASCCSCVCSPF